jgi:hypothetical protein
VSGSDNTKSTKSTETREGRQQSRVFHHDFHDISPSKQDRSARRMEVAQSPSSHLEEPGWHQFILEKGSKGGTR